MNTPAYGALPENWSLLAIGCDLLPDLLPVVSDPDAPISKGSNMKFKGKTPSIYNRRGEVTGFTGWTTHKATTDELREWSTEPQFGICVQTRRIRALDLDVQDDAEVAAIEKFVRAVLGPDVPLAVRRRPNSSKCLIAFEVCDVPPDQDLYKRTVKTAHGMIEFLATGQQFIAYGTHPSGVRYEWENEGEFPVISLHVWESLWERLVKRFGIGEPTSSAARKRGVVLAGVTDRIVGQLEDLDLVLGWGKDGQAHITCPFSDEHTSESVVSATSYFPAGTGGYERGHFKCLHAHCAHRTDEEFGERLGLYATDLGELSSLTDGADDSWDTPVDPVFNRGNTGEVKPTVHNLQLALSAPHVCGFTIARDVFLEDVMLKPYTPDGSGKWRRLQDEDYMALRIHLEQSWMFEPLNTGNVKDVLHMVARAQHFDSAEEFVKGLVWDGIPRVDRFFTDYIPTSNPTFGKAVARYLFSALAGRALHGGIKADMAPILIGGQGLGKSTAIAALAPIPDVFVDFNLAADDEKRVRLIKGKLVAELGEMRGLWGSQIEDIKAFIARQLDHWVPKYKEQAIHYPRRCVFIGTANNHDILNDSTGSRRFLPMTVTGDIDVAQIARDCLQLWAEGRVLFETHGILWREAQTLGRENNAAYTTEDPWTEIVKAWLEKPDLGDEKTVFERQGYVTTATILTRALGHKESQVNAGHGKRVGEVMRVLGYVRKRVRVGGGAKEYVWAEPDVSQSSTK